MYNLKYTPTTLGYKVEEKLYLGVREQKRLNTTALDQGRTTLPDNWASRLSGKASDFHYGDFRFEYRLPGHRPSWLIFIVDFFRPTKKIRRLLNSTYFSVRHSLSTNHSILNKQELLATPLNIKGGKTSWFGPLANYADRATAACWRSSANFCG
jgi:hypothetical protein